MQAACQPSCGSHDLMPARKSATKSSLLACMHGRKHKQNRFNLADSGYN